MHWLTLQNVRQTFSQRDEAIGKGGHCPASRIGRGAASFADGIFMPKLVAGFISGQAERPKDVYHSEDVFVAGIRTRIYGSSASEKENGKTGINTPLVDAVLIPAVAVVLKEFTYEKGLIALEVAAGKFSIGIDPESVRLGDGGRATALLEEIPFHVDTNPSEWVHLIPYSGDAKTTATPLPHRVSVYAINPDITNPEIPFDMGLLVYGDVLKGADFVCGDRSARVRQALEPSVDTALKGKITESVGKYLEFLRGFLPIIGSGLDKAEVSHAVRVYSE